MTDIELKAKVARWLQERRKYEMEFSSLVAKEQRLAMLDALEGTYEHSLEHDMTCICAYIEQPCNCGLVARRALLEKLVEEL